MPASMMLSKISLLSSSLTGTDAHAAGILGYQGGGSVIHPVLDRFVAVAMRSSSSSYLADTFGQDIVIGEMGVLEGVFSPV
jgi:hypothetical protein